MGTTTEGCSRLQVITSSPGLRPRPLTTMLIPSVVFCWSVISCGVALIRPAMARRAARKTSSRFWFAGGAVGPADSMAKVSRTAAMTERGRAPCQPVLRYVSEAVAGISARMESTSGGASTGRPRRTGRFEGGVDYFLAFFALLALGLAASEDRA